jgi:hypothetical protein
MTILKRALLGSLRIVVFGSLKLALFAYTLFVSDTAFVGAAPEGSGHVGDTGSYTASENNSDANSGQKGPDAFGRPASGR